MVIFSEFLPIQEYTKSKGLEDNYYIELIISHLKTFGEASKKEITDLLFSKLPDIMTDKQKNNKIVNILQKMRRSGIIQPTSSNKNKTKWKLCK